MIQLGLIGAGISRSQAKRLHEFMGPMYGLEVNYKPLDSDVIEGFDFERVLKRCGEEGFRGVNVTHPFKEKVRALVEVPDPMVARIGAINTVIFEPDGRKGYNTDYTGFAGGFRHRFGDTSPGVALIVGTGGVGKAMAFALGQLGAEEIWLYDLEAARAEGLAAILRDAGLKVAVIGAKDLKAAMREADGLLNGTPLGMFQHPGNPFPVDAIGGQRWVFDAVYTPMETEFVKAARAQSLEVMSGYDLFLFQGFHAFKFFTGIEVDPEAVMKSFPPPANIA